MNTMILMSMKFFTRGKRGDIFLETVRGKTIIVKKKRADSKALNSIANEAFWLKKLNTKGIGPTFISFTNTTLRMAYIHGTPFVEFYDTHKGTTIINTILHKLFRQCRTMDILQVNKEEMHKPFKHIIIQDNTPVMIDFERCKRTTKPQNITQFCQFLVRLGVLVDKEALKATLQAYKKDYSTAQYTQLLRLFHLR